MRRVLLAAVMSAWAVQASAQQVALEIKDGLVTLTASNASVRQVLAEWARVGGTRVVGAERLGGPPLSLRLEQMPEAKALDVILRGAAGFLAATRAIPGAGASAFDRILVLATSTAPTAASGPQAGAAGRAAGRLAPQPVQELPERDTSDTGADEAPVVEPNANPFAGAFAQPGAVPFGQPGTVFGQPTATPFGQPVQVTPFGQPASGATGLFVPIQPDQTPPAQGFFGVVGSSTPGTITPPPQNQQPGTPGARPRPPGQ